MIRGKVRSARLLLGGISLVLAGASACQLIFPYGPAETSTSDGGGDAADATNHSDGTSESATEGGSCADVACQAQTLASGMIGPSAIRVANSTVYWSSFTSDPNSDNLSCVGTNGGMPTTLVQGVPYIFDFVVDSTQAYLSASITQQKILAYAFPSGQPCQSGGQPTDFSDDAFALWTAIDDANVYWFHEDPSEHFVSMLPKDAGPDVEAGVVYKLPFGFGAVGSLTAFGGKVYFDIDYPPNDGGNVGSIGYVPILDGGPGTESGFSGNVVVPAGVAVDATGIYWVNQGASEADGSVWKYPQGGGAQQLAMGQVSPQGITVDDSFVYWTNAGTVASKYSDGTVMRAPKTGSGSMQATPLATGQAQPVAIATDRDNVYWVNCGAGGNPCMYPSGSGRMGAVMKLSKCACP